VSFDKAKASNKHLSEHLGQFPAHAGVLSLLSLCMEHKSTLSSQFHVTKGIAGDDASSILPLGVQETPAMNRVCPVLAVRSLLRLTIHTYLFSPMIAEGTMCW
jgi:hypothetical protein